jgi:hypothetical protein
MLTPKEHRALVLTRIRHCSLCILNQAQRLSSLAVYAED